MASSTRQRSTFKPPAPATYSFRQLEELWIGAGGPRLEAPYAAAIALAESKGVPTAEDHNQNGSIDRGLWQINSVHGSLSTTDVAANAKAAVQVFNEAGKSWSPWVTFKTGAYKAYLTPANLRSGVKAGEAIEPRSILDPLTVGPEEAGNAIKEAFSWKGLTGIMLKFVLLLAGAVLFVYGIMVAVRPRESAFSVPKVVPVPV